MSDPLLALTSQRSDLFQQLSELGDCQPNSVTSAFHRCGNPNCHCSKPDEPGHGPQFQITGKIEDNSFTQSLPSSVAIRKAKGKIAEFHKLKSLTGKLIKESRKICRLRPVGQEQHTLQEKKRRKRSSQAPSSVLSHHPAASVGRANCRPSLPNQLVKD